MINKDYIEYEKKGTHYLDLGDLQQALHYLNKSIELCPSIADNSTTYLRKAEVYERKGNNEQAIEIIEKVIAGGKGSTLLFAYNDIGSIYNNLGMWEQSVHYFHKGTKISTAFVLLDPHLHSIISKLWFNLGRSLTQMKAFQAAIEAYGQALELIENDPDYYIMRAIAFISIKEFEMALLDLSKAEKFTTKDPTLYFYRFVAMIELGRKKEALNAGQHFLKLGGGEKFGNEDQIRVKIAILYSDLHSDVDIPTNPVEGAKVKFAAARELIRERNYKAARKLLETMNEYPKAVEWLEKLTYLEIAQAINSPHIGLLEEWIIGNSLFREVQDFHLYDANTYLMGGYSLEIVQSIVDKLKETNQLDNLVIDRSFLSGVKMTGVSMVNANLSQCILTGSDLRSGDFMYSRFIGADLSSANLEGITLYEANLSRANLSGCNLQNADLTGADLSGVNLTNANLSGANLVNANLQGANLQNTIFSPETKLPDKKNWTQQSDMLKFVNFD